MSEVEHALEQQNAPPRSSMETPPAVPSTSSGFQHYTSFLKSSMSAPVSEAKQTWDMLSSEVRAPRIRRGRAVAEHTGAGEGLLELGGQEAGGKAACSRLARLQGGCAHPSRACAGLAASTTRATTCIL